MKQAEELKLHLLLWLSLGVTLAMLPHVSRIPIWVSIMYFALVGWRLFGPLLGWPLPNRNWRTLVIAQYILAGIGVLAVFKAYGNLSGRDPGVALLVLLAGFKFMESRSERDYYIGICLGYILVVTNFFYTQTIPTAIYMTLVVIVLTTCFIVLNDRNRVLDIRRLLQMSGKLLLLACPMMLVMFVLFPRVSGPLWGMPKDAHSGLMGIDDSMAPGSISELLQSDALAFRVKFKQSPPGKSRMYWRGPVLTYNNGQRWSRNKALLFKPKNQLSNLGEAVEYSVTMEASNHDWLFALDMPYHPSFGKLTNDYQIVTRKKIRERIRYDMASYPDYQIEDEIDLARNAALQLPSGFHPRTVELARQWQEQGLSDEQITEKVMRWFQEEEFYYTLKPPLLEGDHIDQFLFESRQGFCEHYASAFVVLMRAAGIPARVVTGYLGATYNPIGDYYNVYQRDAHAWAEVWLEGKGWQRMDPTSAVSPLRVLEGIEEALPELAGSFSFDYGKTSLTYEVLRQLVDSWDNLNYNWSQWVLGYGPQRQKELMQMIGFRNSDWQNLTFSLTILLLIMLFLFGFMLFMYRPRHEDAARLLYDRFCKKLARAGLKRSGHEGPIDFARRASRRFPRLRNQIEQITELYISIRYRSKEEFLPELKSQVYSFQPGKT